MDENCNNDYYENPITEQKAEVEKLIQLLLLSSDEVRSISSDPQFADCVEHLLHFSVDELAATPRRIKVEEEQIRAKIEQLAVENYPIFLSNADTSREVHREFKSISASNEALLNRLAEASCSAQNIFDNVGKNASSFHVHAKSTQYHAQILEFLEIPQIMETCVQNGYYQDALHILSHTKQMNKKHGHDIPLIRMVALQAQEISVHLFNQLCAQLREPITLPVCLKVVIYLRQLEAFTEQDLRLNFLQARSICIEDQIELALAKPISTSKFVTLGDSSHHLTGPQRTEYAAFVRAMRRIEVTRVQLFDSITQYRAVFADETIYSSSIGSPPTESTNQGLTFSDISPLNLDEDTALSRQRRHLTTSSKWNVEGLSPASESSLFHAWLLRQITIFLECLSRDLDELFRISVLSPHEVSDRIQLAFVNDSMNLLEGTDADTAFQRAHSIMTQAFYFGRSFARIGCDFRAHLDGIFTRALVGYFEKLLANALTEFNVTLVLWPWEIEPASLGLSSFPAPQTANEDHQANNAGGEIEAPPDVACYPSVAFFCNRLLTALNGLRMCCPVGIKQGVVVACVRTLHSAAVAIREAYTLRQTDSATTRLAGAHLASSFAHLAAPHILSCLLEHLFGGDAAAHLWQLHNPTGDDIPSSTEQQIARLTQQICEPFTRTWGQLSNGGLSVEANHQEVVVNFSPLPVNEVSHESLATVLEANAPPVKSLEVIPKSILTLEEVGTHLTTGTPIHSTQGETAPPDVALNSTFCPEGVPQSATPESRATSDSKPKPLSAKPIEIDPSHASVDISASSTLGSSATAEELEDQQTTHSGTHVGTSPDRELITLSSAPLEVSKTTSSIATSDASPSAQIATDLEASTEASSVGGTHRPTEVSLEENAPGLKKASPDDRCQKPESETAQEPICDPEDCLPHQHETPTVSSDDNDVATLDDAGKPIDFQTRTKQCASAADEDCSGPNEIETKRPFEETTAFPVLLTAFIDSQQEDTGNLKKTAEEIVPDDVTLDLAGLPLPKASEPTVKPGQAREEPPFKDVSEAVPKTIEKDKGRVPTAAVQAQNEGGRFDVLAELRPARDIQTTLPAPLTDPNASLEDAEMVVACDPPQAFSQGLEDNQPALNQQSTVATGQLNSDCRIPQPLPINNEFNEESSITGMSLEPLESLPPVANVASGPRNPVSTTNEGDNTTFATGSQNIAEDPPLIIEESEAQSFARTEHHDDPLVDQPEIDSVQYHPTAPQHAAPDFHKSPLLQAPDIMKVVGKLETGEFLLDSTEKSPVLSDSSDARVTDIGPPPEPTNVHNPPASESAREAALLNDPGLQDAVILQSPMTVATTLDASVAPEETDLQARTVAEPFLIRTKKRNEEDCGEEHYPATATDTQDCPTNTDVRDLSTVVVEHTTDTQVQSEHVVFRHDEDPEEQYDFILQPSGIEPATSFHESATFLDQGASGLDGGGVTKQPQPTAVDLPNKSVSSGERNSRFKAARLPSAILNADDASPGWNDIQGMGAWGVDGGLDAQFLGDAATGPEEADGTPLRTAPQLSELSSEICSTGVDYLVNSTDATGVVVAITSHEPLAEQPSKEEEEVNPPEFTGGDVHISKLSLKLDAVATSEDRNEAWDQDIETNQLDLGKSSKPQGQTFESAKLSEGENKDGDVVSPDNNPIDSLRAAKDVDNTPQKDIVPPGASPDDAAPEVQFQQIIKNTYNEQANSFPNWADDDDAQGQANEVDQPDMAGITEPQVLPSSSHQVAASPVAFEGTTIPDAIDEDEPYTASKDGAWAQEIAINQPDPKPQEQHLSPYQFIETTTAPKTHAGQDHQVKFSLPVNQEPITLTDACSDFPCQRIEGIIDEKPTGSGWHYEDGAWNQKIGVDRPDLRQNPEAKANHFKCDEDGFDLGPDSTSVQGNERPRRFRRLKLPPDELSTPIVIGALKQSSSPLGTRFIASTHPTGLPDVPENPRSNEDQLVDQQVNLKMTEPSAPQMLATTTDTTAVTWADSGSVSVPVLSGGSGRSDLEIHSGGGGAGGDALGSLPPPAFGITTPDDGHLDDVGVNNATASAEVSGWDADF